MAVDVDVSDEASVENLIKTSYAELGSINYFVHCAGVSFVAVLVSVTLTLTLDQVGPASLNSIDDVAVSEFDRVNGVNTRGTFFVIRAISKAMLSQPERTVNHRNGPRSIGRGSIVVVASGLGLVGMAGNLSYCTSKHAVLGLVKTAGE